MRLIKTASLVVAAGLLAVGCSSSPSGKTKSTTPGGASGRDVLSQHKALNGQGQVSFPQAAVTDAALQQAYCNYIFGSVSEVRAAAGLPKTVALDSKSGFIDLGSNGLAFTCTYDTAPTKPVFVIQVTTGHPDRTSAKGTVVVNLTTKRQAALGYAPDFVGTVITKAKAEVWLRAAGKRVSP